MKHCLYFLLLLLTATFATAQNNTLDKQKIKEDLHEILSDIRNNYVYLSEKNIDTNCLRTSYEARIDDIKTNDDVVLFFEYLLDELYDGHVILNTNRRSSYRLFAPIYVTFQNNKWVVSNAWETMINDLPENIIGTELRTINSIDISAAIENFPTRCHNKQLPAVREWIANKLLAGRYDQPRSIGLQLNNGRSVSLNLDQFKYKRDTTLLSVERRNNIGIIRIHNALGNSDLVSAFDKALDALFNTKAMIIDLRNTVDGGTSYVARGIMSRFLTEAKAYQKHLAPERSGNNPVVERSWLEFVHPRGRAYTKPVYILVGRWTGSMGEGIAVGFEGIKRGIIVGTEMERLAGEMEGFSFKHQSFGYRLSTAKLYHVNGTPREKYLPPVYVKQTTIEKDETLAKAIALIEKTK